jgi:hypothetical protein
LGVTKEKAMLSWFRRHNAPSTGPDYRHVDSREKAEELYRRGELQKLLLLPTEFGGQDIPPNIVYVPAMAVELKARIDLNTIGPLAEKGQVSRYTATPEYEGKSAIPSLIRISATDPGHFEGTIAIWGKPVQQNPNPISKVEALEQPSFTPAATPVETLGPEEFVRAYIVDYESWNKFAYGVSAQDPSTGMEVAESAYDALVQKYCPPGHAFQPIAFGSDSAHDDAREAIVSAEPEADTCVVKTRHTKTLGKLNMTDDYEYHLKKIGRRWFLVSVLYVDQDGTYEGL